MGLMNRPYIGTWKLDGKKLIQSTPDALVYINGDTTIPGCPKCSGRINFQKFITEVSVDAGTEPGSASGSFTLSVPLHHTDSFARDANFILRPGLEVHIYMRGYFPVAGLYSHLAEPQLASDVVLEPGDMARRIVVAPVTGGVDFTADPPAALTVTDGVPNYSREQIQEWAGRVGVSEEVLLAAIVITSESGDSVERPLITDTLFNRQAQTGDSIWDVVTGSASTTGKQNGQRPYSTAQVPRGKRLEDAVGVVKGVLKDREGGDSSGNVTNFMHVSTQRKLHAKSPAQWRTPEAVEAEWIQGGLVEYPTGLNRERVRFYGPKGWTPNKAAVEAQATSALAAAPSYANTAFEEIPEGQRQMATPQAALGPSLLDQYGLSQDVANVIAYPYYHCFHGVVTEVGHAWSGGINTITVNCSSMLHFWSYQNMSSNASVFGARPTNSKLKMSMVGHNFTGMHPYQILYTLHHDVAGAAGGVGWALSSAGNQTAVTEVGGESLFSLNIKYWQKRFQGRMIKLRLHGANGELFSTMQAAWLGRSSSNQLTKLIRKRYDSPASSADAKDILGQSIAVGMYDARKREALVQAYRSKPEGAGNDAKFEINMVEMQAFVSNISEWGQIQLFESTYQTKLDIANTVCEVTGFEFYQDVDGDFVFKPPFYNLDTSGSRVYVIEDIDLISMNFSEKEPVATYMTVKGSQFANLQGTGLENEWGVRGQYIDYRLVAQFGWRPGSYETAYFNDPKSMFFAAVNRMDLMNVGCKSASLTIPIRPELRPGYPVYIRYLDCYYYCNSFAHSFSVGGQCTTSLQLVGKRAKFFAPGVPSQSGIESIRLGNTSMPQKPLGVIGDDGNPRLSGFPNVVMALDPTEVNPLFFVVGVDMERLDDIKVLKWVLQIAVGEGILKFTPEGEDSSATGLYSVSSSAIDSVTFYFQENDLTGSAAIPKGATGKVFNVVSEGTLYMGRLGEVGNTMERKREELTAVSQSLQSLQYKFQQANEQMRVAKDDTAYKKAEALSKSLQTQIDGEERKIQIAVSNIEAERKAFEDEARSGKISEGVMYLLKLIDITGEKYRSARTAEGSRFGDLQSSINLLDMLSDKKATFSNGTQPGSYRYYSASHPEPKDQGQMEIRYTEDGLLEGPPQPPTVEAYRVSEILGYIPSAQITAPFPGAKLPDAKLIRRTPTTGIRVLTSNPNFKDGEVLPTDQIAELMFSVQDVSVVKRFTTTKNTASLSSYGSAADAAAGTKFSPRSIGRKPTETQTIKSYFEGTWNSLAARVQQGITEVTAAATAKGAPVPPGMTVPQFPAVVLGVPVDKTFNDAKPTTKNPVGAIAEKMAVRLGKDFMGHVSNVRKTAGDFLGKKVTNDDRRAIMAPLSASVTSITGLTISTGDTVTVSGKRAVDTKTFSPVFPVSDGKGYEVFGTYRYGRGLDVDAEGVFAQIAAQDPFSLLSKDTVDRVLRTFIQQGTAPVPTKTVEKGGSKVTVPVTEDYASMVQKANAAVLKDLRAANLTDKQILDYAGLVTAKDGNPNLLQLNCANLFATHNEGVLKTPLNNAAFSLGDLSPIRDIQVCACKAAEADMLLEAFGNQAFLAFSDDDQDAVGEESGGTVTKWLRQEVTKAAVPWKQAQDAMRGTALDLNRSNLATVVSNFPKSVETAQQQVASAEANYEDAKERLLDAANKVGD